MTVTGVQDGPNGTRLPGRVPTGPLRPVDPDVSGGVSISRLPVVIEKLDGGRLRMTSPDLPGWSAVGRGAHELARNVDEAWMELQIAAYAGARGEAYDLAHHEVRAEQPKPGRYGPGDPLPDWRDARNGYDPSLWRPLPGGDFESPSGRRYGAGSWQVQRIVAKRLAAGLPVVHPDDAQ